MRRPAYRAQLSAKGAGPWWLSAPWAVLATLTRRIRCCNWCRAGESANGRDVDLLLSCGEVIATVVLSRF